MTAATMATASNGVKEREGGGGGGGGDADRGWARADDFFPMTVSFYRAPPFWAKVPEIPHESGGPSGSRASRRSGGRPCRRVRETDPLPSGSGPRRRAELRARSSPRAGHPHGRVRAPSAGSAAGGE